MLHNIATHIIAGPLGAGKTTLIRHLMLQRPASERWAVLINEFGSIGLDAALLATGDDGIALGEVAGGCLCCVNGAPFQVGLGRLLRKAQPDRLFIEPSGLGHPLQLLRQLEEFPWRGVLDVQPLVMVIDALALVEGQSLNGSQQEALANAQLLVISKAQGLGDAQRLWITEQYPSSASYHWGPLEGISLASLPVAKRAAVATQAGIVDKVPDPSSRALSTAWLSRDEPVCQISDQAEGWSIGWRWHPGKVFDRQAVASWLGSLSYLRAKLVIHSSEGWQSCNAVGKGPFEWRGSEWRRDSRLELIFSTPQDVPTLQAAFKAASACAPDATGSSR